MFFKFIVFGGLEEIGWRYVFQPLLQEKFHYFQATILTFIIWSIWHLLFFYIDGSLAILQIVPFLFGLLTNSFILSALYLKTKNLWICVMTHSMINVFSQMTMSDDHYGMYLIRIIVIVASCYLVMSSKVKYKTY
ncbi:CAAX amino protease [Streptococcus infantis SPAR10]|jgi:CAAX amino protease|uniref:CAAX amino protease n=2 Tax=Streptococcus TaxID=1301 RepID=J0YK38_9STRE|nr:CAAX amino protease [Streptococcus infantis SPAR10]